MKRRKALLGIALLGGAFVSYVGFKWFRINSTPDFTNLEKNRNLIAALADTIIPASDSPSASQCNVQDFIIKMIAECTEPRTQNNFMSGLSEVEKYSSTSYGKSFVDCSLEERNRVVSYFSDKDALEPGLVGKVQKKVLGKPFFTILREYTVIGYFTSEQGATQALRYAHIPSKYIACEPYSPGEKAWATY